MENLPKLPRIAAIVAFIVAGLAVLAALTNPIVLPVALVPLFAGIGIRRKRVWSAYGYSLFAFAQLALLPLIVFRAVRTSGALTLVIATAIWSLLIGVLFLLAGRSLATTGGPRGVAWPWISLSAIYVLLFLLVEPFVIPTGAMENTILVGDHVLVPTLPHDTPVRDEIVVYIYPVDRRQTFVKRIAGISGDRIRISEKNLYRNGIKIDEPYVVHKTDYMDAYRDNFPGEPNTPLAPQAQEMLSLNVLNGEVIVPAGKYFVLGDNRDQSLDSRYTGFVSNGDIIGKPIFIYYSVDRSLEELTGSTRAAFPPRIRWNRIFRPL